MAITQRFDKYQLPAELLQRIAEDLDRLAAPGADTRINIENKIDAKYQTARLTILNRIFDGKDKPRTFEKIVWQTNYDPDIDSLILYRSHSGLAGEDMFSDKQYYENTDEETELFVPLCSGISLFKIQVLRNEELEDKWTEDALPRAIVATISFAAPFEAVSGELDVAQEEKITRTIAIDRTRKIKFNIPKRQEDEESAKTGKDRENAR